MCSDQSQTQETAGLICSSAELCFNQAERTGQQRKWEVHIAAATWYDESLPFLVPPRRGLYHRQGVNKHKGTQTELIKASTPKQSSLDVWGSAAAEEHACRDWEGRHVSHTCSLFLSLSLSLSVHSICKIKKSRYLLETDPVPHRWFRLSSNGRLSHWVPLCYQLVLQTLISAPAFLPLPLCLSLSLSLSLSLQTHTCKQTQMNIVLV